MLGMQTTTATHAFILCVLIMLSFKQLNPVARVCMLFGTDDTMWVGVLCMFLLFWLVVTDLRNVTYYAGFTFFNSLLSIFFSSIEVIGKEHIPSRGDLAAPLGRERERVGAAGGTGSGFALRACWRRRLLLGPPSRTSRPLILAPNLTLDPKL